VTIQEQLVAEQRKAMKSGDKATLSVIRQIQSEVSVAKSAPGFRGDVDDELYRATIAAFVKRMQKARTEFEAAGERGQEHVDQLTFEVGYLSAYLPTQLSEDETRELVKTTIAELGVDDASRSGQVIGVVMKSGAEVDGATVSRLVREELGG
jgi:uncharacterized protein YqeY